MSKEIDVSIIIVHAFQRGLLRQTLRGLRRSAPKLRTEIIIVDNNIEAGVGEMLKEEFPHIQYIALEKNLGFGSGMNRGIEKAKGKYVFIFSQDIVPSPGSIEGLFTFMEENKDIGICGPKLLNADGTIQYSCLRNPSPKLAIFRRTPLKKLSSVQVHIDEYLMKHDEHNVIMDVDWLMGAAMFARREVLEQIGMFDEQFFLYYEDNDLCRRVWEHGARVVYFPEASMTHYHRRQSADGSIFSQLFSKITWIHIHSAYKYFRKYRKKENPRHQYFA